jgi:uncharacterized membrane protein
MVNPNMLINIAVIVLMGYIAIILLSAFQQVSSCDAITGTTLQKACNAWFNNAATLFLIGATLLLLLIIPMIRNVVGGGGGGQGGGY